MNPLQTAVGLFDHYESIAEVKHYYGLMAIYGLCRTAEASNDSDLAQRCEKILRRFPDEIEHPEYNFPSYRIGGIPQAFLVSTGAMPERTEAVREYAEEMLTAPRDALGIMKHPRHPESDLVWIDVATAATPFLLYAGLALAEPRYIDEAVLQVTLMYDDLLDTQCGLLHQCRGFIGPGLYSHDHWSRGNGWGYFALAELLRGLPDDSPHLPGVLARYTALTAAMAPHQSKRGLWRQEIPLDLSYEESSGSGLILYGIGVGLRKGVLDPAVYRPIFDQGIAGLTSVAINDDLSTENSCPGCCAPGEGADKGTVQSYVTLRLPYRDELHSFGPLMLALTEAALLEQAS